MAKRRVFISARNTMPEYVQAAMKAIKNAGMEHIFYGSVPASTPIPEGVEIKDKILESVRSSDAFVGIYGEDLIGNYKYGKKYSLVAEYEAAVKAGLLPFCVVSPNPISVDDALDKFLKKVRNKKFVLLSEPKDLYKSLLAHLKQLKPRIFISYSSKDADFINDELYKRLKKSGYQAWLNTENISKGGPWYTEMTDGVHETTLLILVVSPDSMQSKWVEEEWATFLKLKKKVLPILYRESELPESISSLEMIKFQDTKWYDRLIKAIEQNL